MRTTDAKVGRGRTALLIGNYRPALAAARELYRLGWKVTLGCEPGSTGAEHSRYVADLWPMPALEPGFAAYRAALAALLARRPDIALAVPITEATLNATSAVRDVLAPGVRLAAPPAEVLAICHDKARWLEFSAAAGVDTPAFGSAASLAELRGLLARLGYPVVLRPREAGKRIGKRKALMLEGPADLDRLLPEWPTGIAAILAQRQFRGERYNIYFGAADGLIIRELTSRSLRTDRWDGSGQTIEGEVVEPLPGLSADLRRVAAAMAYTGVGCAQFLYDAASGRSCFLEINPRFGASYVFVERSGLELTGLAVELAGPALPAAPDPRPLSPIRFVWTYGDLSGLLYSLRRREIGLGQALRWLGRAIAAAVRADVHVTWSWDDPRPALRFYAGRFLRPGRRTAGAAAPEEGAPPLEAS
jgi:predicted ATP-grasp superfamily ATP-dependent carboligase